MSSILDAFIIEFGLDPAKFTVGQKAVIEGMHKTEEEALRVAKEIEEHGKQAAEFFRELRNQVIGLYAAFTAGRGLKEFITDITHSDSQIGYMAKRLDMSVNELARWQGAMASVGGTAEDATSTFSALTHDFQSLLITGNSQFLPYFRALGVQISDVNGRMRSQTAIMDDLNKVFSKMDPARAQAFGAAMGITPKMMDLLTKAPGEYHRILLEQEKLRYETEADAKAAQAREAAWDNFLVTATNLGRQILTALTPAFMSVLSALTNIAIWFNAHPVAIKAAFAAITAVVGLLTLAIAEKLVAGALGRLLTMFAQIRVAGLAAFTSTGSAVGLLTKGALSLLPILGLLSTGTIPGLGNSLLELGIVGPSAFSLISAAVGLGTKGLIGLAVHAAALAETVFPALAESILGIGLAIEATPIGWIVTGLAGIGAAAILLYRNWDWVWTHMADVVRKFIPLYNNVVAPILGLPKFVEKAIASKTELETNAEKAEVQTTRKITPEEVTPPTLNVGSTDISNVGQSAVVSRSVPARVSAITPPTVPTLGPVSSVQQPRPRSSPYTGTSRPEAAARGARESDIQAFISMGWTRDQAIGIVANEVRESGGNERAVGDRGAAYGLAQWHPDRQSDFAKFTGHDIRQSTRGEQLAFINHELREGSRKRAGEALKKTTSAPEAAQVVSNKFEAPRDLAGEASIRAQIAVAISNLPASLLATAGAGSRANVTNDNRVTHYNSDTRVGQVIVQTQATDAGGIAKDLKPILQRQSFAAAADTGPN